MIRWAQPLLASCECWAQDNGQSEARKSEGWSSALQEKPSRQRRQSCHHLPSSFLTSVGCPGWSAQRRTKSSQGLVDFMISTTVSLTGSLFFSSHPVTL